MAERGPITGTSLYLVLKSNGLRHPKNLPVKFGFSPIGISQILPKSYRYNSVPNRFSSHFSASRTNGPRSLSRVKAGTHSAFGEGSHTRAHTPKQGTFRMGALLLPSERPTRFGNPAWPGFKTASFAAFVAWSLVLPKNAESLRDSDALMRVAVPKASQPRWAA